MSLKTDLIPNRNYLVKISKFSAINPLIYIFVGNDFRRRFKTCRRFIEVKIQKYQSRKSNQSFGKSAKSKAKDLKYYDSVVSKSDSHHEGSEYFLKIFSLRAEMIYKLILRRREGRRECKYNCDGFKGNYGYNDNQFG